MRGAEGNRRVFIGFRASYSTSVCGGVLRFVSGFLGEGLKGFPNLSCLEH